MGPLAKIVGVCFHVIGSACRRAIVRFFAAAANSEEESCVRLADNRATSLPTGWYGRAWHHLAASVAWLRAAIGWQVVTLLLVSGGMLLGAYQVERPFAVIVGSTHANTFALNFHDRETAEDGVTLYRWTHETSFLIFKGVGGGRERAITLRMRSGRPAGVVQPVTVFINGIETRRLNIGSEWQSDRIEVRGAATDGHGMVVELRSPAEKLPTSGTRVVGVQVNQLSMETTGGRWTVPAWTVLGQIGLVVLILYLIAARMLEILVPTAERRRTIAALVAVGGALFLAWLMIVERPYIAAFALMLAGALLGSLAALLLVRPLVWLAGRLGMAMTLSEGTALCVILALGVALKLGGLLYPNTVVSDLAWHSKWERTLLRGGWKDLYYPSELSSGPSVWGAGILIPKSPLYYAAMAPFTLLPLSVGTVLKLTAAVMELAIPFFVYTVFRRIGRATTGIVAAFLYTVSPLSYLILSYGSYPTLFALFLTALTFAVVLFAWDRLAQPKVFSLFVVLLMLSLLAYPVVAVFNCCVLVAFGLWRLWQATDRDERRRAGALPVGTALAALLAFAVYYVQYVRVVLQSIHTLTSATAKDRGYTRGGLPGAPLHIATVIADNIRVGNLLILVIIAAVGAVLLYQQSTERETRRTWQLLLVWLLVLPVFTLVDAYIDMILKQLFYTMIPVALFGSVTVGWLWKRGRIGQVIAVLCCVVITAQAWWLWLHRIAYLGHSGTLPGL